MTTKRYTIVTLFPELFPGPLGVGVTGRGIEKGLLSIHTISIRAYGHGRHKVVDDAPYGGGSGMVMKPEPVCAAIEEARRQAPQGTPVFLMSPQGPTFTQENAQALAQSPGLILVCGRYEGIDERVMGSVDGAISVGDYILSGGEQAAIIVLDAVARLLPGVLGNPESLDEESFGGLLEYPQYTRPRIFCEAEVPEILLSGNHEAIRKWRLEQALRRTLLNRPDLLEQRSFTAEESKLLADIRKESTSATADAALDPQ